MKKRITSYTFDASEKTIAFAAGLEIEGFLLIVNVVDNIIIYNFADATTGGTYAADTLTLAYNTASMDDTDELLIYYDDGLTTQAVSGTITAELSATDNAVLDEIKIDTEAIETAVEAIQAAQLPDGHNVTVDNASLTVDTGLTQPLTDTELRATAVPVSLDISSLATAANQQTDALTDTELRATPVPVSGSVTVDLGANNDVTVTSGSVTANAGTNLNTSALALESGGNLAAIKAKTDNIPALGQALASASVPVILPAATITTLTPPAAITGFATSAKQDTIIGHIDGIEGSVDGIETLLTTIEGNQLADGHNVTVDNLSLTVDTGLTQPLTDTQLRATPVPVSGTVTANLGATDNAVLDDIASDTEAIKTSLAGTLTVTGGGGGVEYTEGDTDATITGSVAMMEVGSDTLQPIQGTVAGGLLVNLGGNNDVTVTGTVDLGATDNAVLDTIAAKDFATQTTLAAMNAKMVTGTDIGDVTINNSTGASAVNIQDGGNTITVDGTVGITANSAVNVAQMNGVATTMGNGASGTGVQRVTIASDSTGQVKLAAGTAAIGKLTANSGVDIGDVDILSIAAGDNNIGNVDIVTMPNVTVGAALPAGTNAIGKLAANSGVDIGDVDVLSLPGSGMTIFRSIDLDESEEEVKATAGTVYGWYLYNNNAATLYMKLYNATIANVTVGTTTPVMTIPVPSGSAANVEFTNGIAFATAISAAVTTGVADNNTGAPAANDFVANIFYK